MEPSPKLISALQALREHKGSDLTDQEIESAYKMINEHEEASAGEPNVLDKLSNMRDTAENAILDTVLPKKKLEDLTPEELQDYQKGKEGTYAKYLPPGVNALGIPARAADKWISERANEPQVDFRDNPRLLTHPELAKSLNLLSSMTSVPSFGSVLKAAKVPEGPRPISSLSPSLARFIGMDPSVRDLAGMTADMMSPAAISAAGRGIKNTAESMKPALSTYPKELPPPLKPYARPEVAELADAMARNDARAIQQGDSSALENTLKDLKEKGISNSQTAARLVNSYNLPISGESAQTLIDAFPDHPEVQKLKTAMERTATGEARTKGNLINPSEQFVVDRGERTPIKTVPTSEPVIGEPHPGATLDYGNDPRFKTHYQDAMEQTSFPFAPDVGEASFQNPRTGNQGAEKLYSEQSLVGAEPEHWHAPEFEQAQGGAQMFLPFESNPDFYKLLQLSNEHARYAPQNLEPAAMEAREKRFGDVANELRGTLKGIKAPLPEQLSTEDMQNLLRTNVDGTTGEKIQGLRNDTTKRIGMQEDLAPIARGDKEMALINRGKDLGDTRAMFQELAEKYNLPQLLERSDLRTAAEKHLQDQKDYLKGISDVSAQNAATRAKIDAKNAKLLADFGKKRFSILPSNKDLYNFATWSSLGPVSHAAQAYAATKAGKLVGDSIPYFASKIPENAITTTPWGRILLSKDLTESGGDNAVQK